MSQVKSVATKFSMSQQTAELTIRTRKEKNFAIEIVKKPKKSCHDRVDRLKRKILVAKRKITSRQIPEAEGNEKLVANKFSVATQDISIVIRTRLLHQNSVATLSKSVASESKK